jgi:DNA polymerase-3 subunit delta
LESILIFLKEYDGTKKLPYEKVSQIVASLRDIDVKSKGVGAYVKF